MKIIFFDIDGTLIDHNLIMSDSTRKAIEQARTEGNVCMINTGRTYRMVGEYLKDWVEFDGCLCGCGTMITYRGKELLHQTFTREESLRIMEGLDRYGIDVILEGKFNNFMHDTEHMHTDLFKKYAVNFKDMGYGAYEEAAEQFDKFYCYIGEDPYRREFFEEFKDLLDYIDREKGFFEIVPKGFSKASGISFMSEYLSVPMEDTVAIGDSNNDLSMLQAAGLAIAMGNSSKDVLAAADYVTTDVDKDGIWNALSWIKRNR